MALLAWRKTREVDTTHRLSSYLDTPLAQEKRQLRLEKLRFLAAYYTGSIYRQSSLWSRRNQYSPSVTVPSIYVNYARMLIDRLTSFSFDRVRGVALTPGTEPVTAQDTATDAEKLLAGFLSHSRIIPRLTAIAREALLFGDVLLKLHYSPGAEMPLALGVVPAEEFDYCHEPDDVRSVRFCRQEFEFTGDAGERLMRREELWRDCIKLYEDELIAGAPPRIGMFGLGSRTQRPRFAFEPAGEIPHPFGRIPAVHVMNRPRLGEKYGHSELEDLTRILDDVNWKLSQRSRNISRTMNAIIKNINGRLVHDQLDDTQIVSVIGENAQLDYLVNDSDLAPVQSHIEELKRALTDLTGVVMLNADKVSGIGAMSGFALSILYEPLLNAARAKRREIGGKVEEFLKLTLEAGARLGLVPEREAADADPRLIYAPDLHFTEQEKFTRLRRELLAAEHGVSNSDQ